MCICAELGLLHRQQAGQGGLRKLHSKLRVFQYFNNIEILKYWIRLWFISIFSKYWNIEILNYISIFISIYWNNLKYWNTFQYLFQYFENIEIISIFQYIEIKYWNSWAGTDYFNIISKYWNIEYIEIGLFQYFNILK